MSAISAGSPSGTMRPRAASRDSAATAGAWPHTGRIMPWVVAAMLAMFCLTPFDSIQLNIPFPFDLTLDRLVLAAATLIWAFVALGSRGRSLRVPHVGAIGVALCVWLAISVLSISLNAPSLVANHEFSLAAKQLVNLAAYVTFFAIVVTSVHRSDARSLVSFWLGLSAVTAIGVIYQYRSGTNPFFDIADTVLPSNFEISAAPSRSFAYERPVNTGPTVQGLAATTLLTLALPFAAQRLLTTSELRARAMYLALSALVLAASLSTGKRSAVILPLVALGVLLVYRPRLLLRYSPLAVLLIGGVLAVAPGVVGLSRSQFGEGAQGSRNSTEGRLGDYQAVLPDVKANPFIGRGFGSYDRLKYRLLDNQWLGTLITTGLLGVFAFAAVLLTCFLRAHRMSRRSAGPTRAPPTIALAAALVCFAVSCGLYDTLSFPQGVYLILFVAALTVIADRETVQAVARPTLSPAMRRAAIGGVAAAIAACGLAVAFATGTYGSVQSTSGLSQGEATAAVSLDTRPSLIALRYANLSNARGLFETAQGVAGANETARAIARAADIDPRELSVEASPAFVAQGQFSAAREAGRDRRAVNLAQAGLPYGVRFTPAYGTPVIRIATRAPDSQAAGRLASAAIKGLKVVLARRSSSGRTPDKDSTIPAGLGPPSSRIEAFSSASVAATTTGRLTRPGIALVTVLILAGLAWIAYLCITRGPQRLGTQG